MFDAERPIGMIELALLNFVDGYLSSPVAYLEGIYPIPEYQGKRISSLMMDKIKEWAISMNCSELASDAEVDNQLSQKFHLKAGFKETYRVVEHKRKL